MSEQVWGNLIKFLIGSKLPESAALAPASRLALWLSHGSHFRADYSWSYCTDVPLHHILSLGHPTLKAIKFSVSMNKLEDSSYSMIWGRVPKLITGALEKREGGKTPSFGAGLTFAQLNTWKGQGLAAGKFFRFKALCVVPDSILRSIDWNFALGKWLPMGSPWKLEQRQTTECLSNLMQI